MIADLPLRANQQNHPFTAPIVRPFTKYFWKKGYAKTIGPMEMTAIAILTLSLGKFANIWLALEIALLAFNRF